MKSGGNRAAVRGCGPPSQRCFVGSHSDPTAFDGLNERFRVYAVESRQVGIQQHFLMAHHTNLLIDRVDQGDRKVSCPRHVVPLCQLRAVSKAAGFQRVGKEVRRFCYRIPGELMQYGMRQL